MEQSPKRGRRRRNERGIIMVLALFTLSTLALVLTASLLVGRNSILATRNYRAASQVHFVAESGIVEALQRINGPGVVDFQKDVVNNWSTFWGSPTHTFAPLSGFGYSVTALASPTNPATAGFLVSTGTGTDGSRNTVVATVVRSDVPGAPPGAVYLATDAKSDTTFGGNSFLVDGNDHDYKGGPGPAAPTPGVATRNATNTQEAIDSLSDGQKDNVTGYGYASGPPIVPSVLTVPWAPSVSQMNDMISKLLALPGVVNVPDKQLGQHFDFGTEANPQITHFTADDIVIKGTGNVVGYGILIVDGNLTISGTLDWIGLVLVRGYTYVKKDVTLSTDTTVTGSATVYGSLWTQSFNFQIGGNAIVYYSSKALALANLASGGSVFPMPVKVTTLADCAQLPAGSGGCPS
jgi:hypothetical protein